MGEAMLLDTRTFCDRVMDDLNGLIDDLQDLTGFGSDSQIRAWNRSLPKISRVLSHSNLSDFHVSIGQPGSMSVEYRLPTSSSWCDVVLLGNGPAGPTAEMIEIKDWDTDKDRPGPSENLIEHFGKLYLHPCDQVRAYTEYCRSFHSGVQEYGATVNGSVFFTSATNASAYRAPPHDAIAAEYPLFTASDSDLTDAFPRYLSQRLTSPSPEFAEAFENGIYKQDRDFIRFVADAVLGTDDTHFVLLDEQRRGFEYCLYKVREILKSNVSQKTVILVEGPPGSGKSVLAALLWAELAKEVLGNVVFTTTSACQKTVWEDLYKNAASHPGAGGIVVPANKFNPGLTPKWVKKQRDQGHVIDVETWRDNLVRFSESGLSLRVHEDQFEVAIVDEAHALIDPTAPRARGVPPSGWSMHAGPQAWHIIRSSKVSIFFLDSDQSYRDNETTSPEAITEFAKDHGAVVNDSHRISLANHQFRCGGSAEYLDWLESVLGMRKTLDPPTCNWRKGPFRFEIHDTPQAVEIALREQMDSGATARLAAAYGRKWKTKKVADPHSLPPSEMDFHIPCVGPEGTQFWSKIWNYAPKQDYTMFIQAPLGCHMHSDPLSEVGCPYVVRGFDYEYLGVLWLCDLVWRDGKWIVDLEHVFESAWPRSIKAARDQLTGKESGNDAVDRLVERVKRGYRIILSRAIRGVHIWFEDDETRDHVQQFLSR